MKKIILIIMLTAVFSFLTGLVHGQTVTLSWLKNKRNIRSYYKSNTQRLTEFDKNTLELIDKNSITPELEPDASELLREILFDGVSMNYENSIKAVDILIKKFQTKKYFFETATDVSFHYSSASPFLTARIFKGLRETMETTPADNLKTFNTVFQNIKPVYITASHDGPLKYGTDAVVVEIIGYMREFIKFSRSGKTENKPEYNGILKDVYLDLALEQGNFTKLEGAKELMTEY